MTALMLDGVRYELPQGSGQGTLGLVERANDSKVPLQIVVRTMDGEHAELFIPAGVAVAVVH